MQTLGVNICLLAEDYNNILAAASTRTLYNLGNGSKTALAALPPAGSLKGPSGQTPAEGSWIPGGAPHIVTLRKDFKDRERGGRQLASGKELFKRISLRFA